MNDIAMSADAAVDTGFVADHLDDAEVRLVEVDVSPAAYKAGHIPGAVFWDAYVDLRHPDFSSISDEELRDLVRRSGIAADTTVVAYGYGAHLGYWLLKSCGHDRVRLMDGSRDQWLDAGHTWSTDIPTTRRLRPTSSAPRSGSSPPGPKCRRWWMKVAGSSSMCGPKPSTQVSTSGRLAPPRRPGRPGHIPGAIHVPVDDLRTSDATFMDTEAMSRSCRIMRSTRRLRSSPTARSATGPARCGTR